MKKRRQTLVSDESFKDDSFRLEALDSSEIINLSCKNDNKTQSISQKHSTKVISLSSNISSKTKSIIESIESDEYKDLRSFTTSNKIIESSSELNMDNLTINKRKKLAHKLSRQSCSGSVYFTNNEMKWSLHVGNVSVVKSQILFKLYENKKSFNSNNKQLFLK